MRSAIYEGVLVHRRREPDHGFRRRIAMPLLDLAEIDEVVDQHPLWSRERTNAVSFRREDFLAGPGTLDAAVRDLVEREVGTRPGGPIAVLAHVRTWGWLFNPIAVYYCYDPTGTRVEHAVADVTSTPWKERHAYVLGPPGVHVVDKAMHVSPFFGMDQSYRIAYDAPSAALHLSIVGPRGRCAGVRRRAATPTSPREPRRRWAGCCGGTPFSRCGCRLPSTPTPCASGARARPSTPTRPSSAGR